MFKLVLRKPAEPNIDNVQFPKDFYHFGQSVDAVDIPDEQIQKWIYEGLRLITDEPFWITASGNTAIIILNFADEYEVIVAKNYWEWGTDKP